MSRISEKLAKKLFSSRFPGDVCAGNKPIHPSNGWDRLKRESYVVQPDTKTTHGKAVFICNQ